MKLTRSVNYNPALFGLIPFVNVIFLLLIFFALSSTFVLQPGISVSLPFSSFTLGPQRNPQIVSMTAGPSPAIYFHDQKVTLDELSKSLTQSRAKEGTLVIRADRGTPYELVVQVMNQGLAAGYAVVLATTEERK
jgi:biopolymer transport protein ExbD